MRIPDVLHQGRWRLRRHGWDVVRFRGDLEMLERRLLHELAIDLVVDVGANVGQYARRVRLLDYHQDILSIEPGRDAYLALARQCEADARWQSVHAALGAHEGSAELHISRNSQSSSLLPAHPRHLEAEPAVAVTGEEIVRVTTLDDLVADRGERLWLKLDCQGSEQDVLAGAHATLPRVRVVQCEMSLVELYRGEATITELLPTLTSLGFDPWWIQPGFQFPATGAALQVDTLFVRSGTHES